MIKDRNNCTNEVRDAPALAKNNSLPFSDKLMSRLGYWSPEMPKLLVVVVFASLAYGQHAKPLCAGQPHILPLDSPTLAAYPCEAGAMARAIFCVRHIRGVYHDLLRLQPADSWVSMHLACVLLRTSASLVMPARIHGRLVAWYATQVNRLIPLAYFLWHSYISAAPPSQAWRWYLTHWPLLNICCNTLFPVLPVVEAAYCVTAMALVAALGWRFRQLDSGNGDAFGVPGLRGFGFAFAPQLLLCVICTLFTFRLEAWRESCRRRTAARKGSPIAPATIKATADAWPVEACSSCSCERGCGCGMGGGDACCGRGCGACADVRADQVGGASGKRGRETTATGSGGPLAHNRALITAESISAGSARASPSKPGVLPPKPPPQSPCGKRKAFASTAVRQRRVPSYVSHARVVTTRVKIHGADPADLSPGYAERLAALSAASGRRLLGVTVAAGCIELVLDSAEWSDIEDEALGAGSPYPQPYPQPQPQSPLAPVAEGWWHGHGDMDIADSGDGTGSGGGDVDLGAIIRALQLPPHGQDGSGSPSEQWGSPEPWRFPAPASWDTAGEAGAAAVPVVVAGAAGGHRNVLSEPAGHPLQFNAAGAGPGPGPQPLPPPLSRQALILGGPPPAAAAAVPAILSVEPRVLSTAAATAESRLPARRCVLAVSVRHGREATEGGLGTCATAAAGAAEAAAALQQPAPGPPLEFRLRTRGEYLPLRAARLGGGGGPDVAASAAETGGTPGGGEGIETYAVELEELPTTPGLLLLDVRSAAPSSPTPTTPGLPASTPAPASRAAPLVALPHPAAAAELCAAVRQWDGGAAELDDLLLDLGIWAHHAQLATVVQAVGHAAEAVGPPALDGRLASLGLHLLGYAGACGWGATAGALRRELARLGVTRDDAGGETGAAEAAVPAAVPTEAAVRPPGSHGSATAMATHGSVGPAAAAAAAAPSVHAHPHGLGAGVNSGPAAAELHRRRPEAGEAVSALRRAAGDGGAAGDGAARGEGAAEEAAAEEERQYVAFRAAWMGAQGWVIQALDCVSAAALLYRGRGELLCAANGITLLACAAGVAAVAARPLMRRDAWLRFVEATKLPRHACYCAAKALIGLGRMAPPPGIRAYELGLGMVLFEGVIIPGSCVLSPFWAAAVGAVKVPLYVAMWREADPGMSLGYRLGRAFMVSGLSVAVTLACHANMRAAFRRRQARLRAAKAKSD